MIAGVLVSKTVSEFVLEHKITHTLTKCSVGQSKINSSHTANLNRDHGSGSVSASGRLMVLLALCSVRMHNKYRMLQTFHH